MLTAVVGSGRKRPHWSNGQWLPPRVRPAHRRRRRTGTELRAGVVERGEADLVDDDDLGAKDGVDDPTDGVVGQTAVERLDELGGGEVAHPPAGVDRRVAERHEQVALARPRRAEQTRVLLGRDPLEAGQVVERPARHRRGGLVELLERLAHREGRRLQPSTGVGHVARGDLGLDQGAQEVLWAPALRLGRDEQLRRELAHGGELQPAQARGQIRRQRRRRGGHCASLGA